MLARPTDGVRPTRTGFGYTVAEAPPLCNTRVCVHYVATGRRRPAAARDWADQNLAVDGLGRGPRGRPDRATARRVARRRRRAAAPSSTSTSRTSAAASTASAPSEDPAKKRTASGYCVLDNDFAAAQFPLRAPRGNLRVTAAHEFFHAIQYAYDYAEDRG